MSTSAPVPEKEISAALENARAALLAERNSQGHWTGELSTSALSTATALVALGSVDESAYRDSISRACRWLRENRNEDGGWGDTTKSFSNISTTLLVWSALSRFGGEEARGPVREAGFWIRDYVGSLDPEAIAETVKARYGKDRTFSVPILMLCAICGTLGKDGWRLVPRLPYELAVLPRSWFAAMRLPVVSYALPALIAIGRAKQVRGKGRWSPCWAKTSRLLEEIQPASGGFLEAAPLTSFVTMALVAAGEPGHPVAECGIRFLLDTVREDGSWPIDTNLATWATTLAVKALACGSARSGGSEQGLVEDPTGFPPEFDTSDAVVDFLLDQQYRERHPFTDTPPGGWAWTDLTGGVPDADDTPGAILALAGLARSSDHRAEEIPGAIAAGVGWLFDLQNRDGGMPTFCRGWGALPFDRSSPDITAHCLRAWNEWLPFADESDRSRILVATKKALRYLVREQHRDGSWHPLWFGNQHRDADESNPTYGTSMVVRALDAIGQPRLADRGFRWLIDNQNSDGGWGAGKGRTPSSIEETSLAVSALVNRESCFRAVDRGIRWLIEATANGTRFEPTPIGFYFAKLWYFERIYPISWMVEALGLRLSTEGSDE